MCGRFTLRAPGETVAREFGLDETPSLRPRFNIAPGQDIPVVRRREDGAAPILEPRRWGLVPPWAKDPKIGNRMINARGETLADKPAFRRALRRQRCLVPADGFYEWQTRTGGKQPYFIERPDANLFAIAGLWERWKGPEDEIIESCTLITTQANEVLAAIHPRMPVVLAARDYALWLDPRVDDPEPILPLLHPSPSEFFAAHPVGGHVNRPKNDDPECVRPVAALPDPDLPF